MQTKIQKPVSIFGAPEPKRFQSLRNDRTQLFDIDLHHDRQNYKNISRFQKTDDHL